MRVTPVGSHRVPPTPPPHPSPIPRSVAATAVAVLLAAAFVASVLSGSVRAWRVRHIPGPRGWPLIGHVAYLLNEPWVAFVGWAARYGGAYKLWVWNKLFVVVSDPDMVREIFVERRTTYPKDDWSYTFMK